MKLIIDKDNLDAKGDNPILLGILSQVVTQPELQSDDDEEDNDEVLVKEY